MTARQVYEAVLIEMNKVQAPSLLLEDFNYLFNKAINQYINKKYNIYDVSQQTTDDLRVLKSSVTLQALNEKSPVNTVTKRDSLYGAIYEFSLPVDYLHLLNCVCNFRVNKPFKCYNAGTFVQFPATRLTADMWSQIINNFYMRPMYKRPYYYIHNVNSSMSVADGEYSTSSPAPWKLGQKNEFEGSFGRTPSSQIDLPTDPGNRDIQHLEILKTTENNRVVSIDDKYGYHYIDDNNHYGGVERKYGLPRYIEFSNAEIQEGSTGGAWVRTGNARVECPDPYNSSKKMVLANPLYSVSVNDVNNTHTVSLKSANWTSEVKNPAPALDSNGGTSIGQITLANRFQKDNEGNYIIDQETGEKVPVTINNAVLVFEWVPLLKVRQLNSVEKVGEVRYGNPSTVRLEIRYGKDNSLFTLDSVYVDYIKAPQFIRITQEQLDLTEDTSQIMEYPDYVCQEIINELVHIVMENSSDPRLNTHIPVSQSIANPAQAQEPAQQQTRSRA